MKSLTTLRRALVAGAAGSLLAGAVAIVAAPAHAAPAAPTLTWGMSQYLNEHLTIQSAAGGATLESGTATFGPGTAVSATADARAVEYTGSVSYGFAPAGPVALYGVTIANPVVTVDATGGGTIAADVSWAGSAIAAGEIADVVVTTFDAAGATLTGTELSATPRWDAAVETDAYGSGKPVEGRSWAKSLVEALPAATRATFYASGSNPVSDEKKFPAPFVAQGIPTVATVATPTVTAKVNAAKDSVEVSGTGFTGGDANYQGVYVGVAPAGGLPDTTTPEGQDAFAGQEWVMAPQIVDGAFTRSVAIETNELKSGVEYAVYTWQAHRHTTDALDTETSVGVLKAKPTTPVAQRTTTQVKVAQKATTKKAGRAKVTVRGAKPVSGKIKVTLKIPGVKKAKKLTVTLKKGKATIKLPKAKKKGTYKVTVKYLGNKTSKASSKTATFKVKK